jgi:hypothetical protein
VREEFLVEITSNITYHPVPNTSHQELLTKIGRSTHHSEYNQNDWNRDEQGLIAIGKHLVEYVLYQKWHRSIRGAEYN